MDAKFIADNHWKTKQRHGIDFIYFKIIQFFFLLEWTFFKFVLGEGVLTWFCYNFFRLIIWLVTATTEKSTLAVKTLNGHLLLSKCIYKRGAWKTFYQLTQHKLGAATFQKVPTISPQKGSDSRVWTAVIPFSSLPSWVTRGWWLNLFAPRFLHIMYMEDNTVIIGLLWE